MVSCSALPDRRADALFERGEVMADRRERDPQVRGRLGQGGHAREDRAQAEVSNLEMHGMGLGKGHSNRAMEIRTR